MQFPEIEGEKFVVVMIQEAVPCSVIGSKEPSETVIACPCAIRDANSDRDPSTVKS